MSLRDDKPPDKMEAFKGTIPNTAIPLHSAIGEDILKRASTAKHVNKLMVERYEKQHYIYSCGIASLALVINAINVAYRIKYAQVGGDKEKEAEYNELNKKGLQRVTDDDIINYESVHEYLQSTNFTKAGLTLEQLQNVAMMLGLGSNAHFSCTVDLCQTEDMTKKLSAIVKNSEYFQIDTADAFRDFVKDYFMRPLTGVIVNYDMGALGYKGLFGHFSPVAGYDADTDRFLVMDVWLDTPPVWILSEDLFKASATVDGSSGLPRGLLHVHELLY